MQHHGCACWCILVLNCVSPAVCVWPSFDPCFEPICLLCMLYTCIYRHYDICSAYVLSNNFDRHLLQLGVQFESVIVSCRLFFSNFERTLCVEILFGNFGWFLLSAQPGHQCWRPELWQDGRDWVAVSFFGHLQTGPSGNQRFICLPMHSNSSIPFWQLCFIVKYMII